MNEDNISQISEKIEENDYENVSGVQQGSDSNSRPSVESKRDEFILISQFGLQSGSASETSWSYDSEN